MNIRLLLLTGGAALASLAIAPALRAQGVASDQLIDSITVTGARERAAVEVPNPTASTTAEDLRAQNLVNPEDALRYLPNLTIRKRYIGDRNALIGGRSFSTLQAPRGLVFMDGYLISNFLGRFDAPRWNMIAPEEIDRVDVLYGPYAAIYPGNSIGTTVVVRTRQPQALEMSVRTTGYTERFGEYGLADEYAGAQASAFFGDRFANGAWFTLAANHQDSTGHPMQYYTVSADASGSFPVVSGPATPVSGVTFDTDPQGRRRAVFGASAGAIDHTIQNQVKLRGGYAFADWLEAEAFVAAWHDDSVTEDRTFMRDATGQPVWSGRVVADGVPFNVPATALAPNTREELHLQWGTTWRTTRDSGWNGSLVYSQYDILEDSLLQANNPDPVAASGGPGTNTERDGTGWRTFEAQAVYTPIEGDWTGGAHALALGFHQNEYQLENPVYNVSDWRERDGVLTQDVSGRTRLQALYAQDHWDIDDRWSLTLGVRYERWSAFDGAQSAGPSAVEYADRSQTATSPKASLAFTPDDAWSFRLSAGRGVRFPTVSELFQGTATATSITVNDPDLQPEVSDSVDFTVEHRAPWGQVRASLFQDDVHDSIYGQTNITVTPNVTNVQNVDRVRTRGIETAFALRAPAIESLSLEGSIAYAQAKILRNDNYPVSVGNVWPRVPDWRGALQGVWRANDALTASLGVRYSGRAYNRLENDDINPDTYGGISRFTFLDARVSWVLADSLELALGIDNITDEHAYQAHPYPGRTTFLEARWSFEGTK
jgi:iron complex outermembrane recepter protein